MQVLENIFNEVFMSLNVVATDLQKSNTFQVACREFFSYVTPLHPIRSIEGVALGDKIENNSLGLDIGSFRIVSIAEMINGYMIGVKPLNYSVFYLDYGYMGAFQYTCEYMLKKVERDNYLMIKSAGIEEPEAIDVENITELRDYLKKEFSVTPAGLI